MMNLFSRLGYILAVQDFFPTRYLCDPSLSSNRFNTSLNKARTFYANNKHRKISPELIHESWLQNIMDLEAYFTGSMDENFMSNGVINGTMVFTDRNVHKVEMEKIREALDGELARKIIASGLNAAFLSGKSNRFTLINSAHHLHHLIRFEQMTDRKISNFSTVVEFGGGYGNMARIVDNFGACKIYSIIDLLLFSCIQSVFLGTVAGSEQVAFDGDHGGEIAKFLLHPLFSSDDTVSLQGELFISTWALSESTPDTYKWVVNHDWFGASNLILAYNENWKPWQDNGLEDDLDTQGWMVRKEEISFLPGSYYLFATR